jgi:hypothetical protein
VNPQTLAQEHHLICDFCGKAIPLVPENVFHWQKLLQLRDMLAGATDSLQSLEATTAVYGGPTR